MRPPALRLLVALVALAPARAGADPPAARRSQRNPRREEPYRTWVITAARDGRDLSDVPAAVTVVEENGRRSPRTLPDLLRGQTGVFVQETTPGQGAPVVRGQVGSALLTLVDGLRLNSTIFRPAPTQYGALVDPYDVERIEIVRGSGATLYGSDAIGGVVQVITPGPRFFSDAWQVRGRALGQVSSADAGGVSRLSVAAGRAGLGMSAGLTVQQHNDLRAGGDRGRQRPTGWSAYAGDAKVVLERGRHEATLAASYYLQPSTPRYDELNPGFGQSAPSSSEFRFEPNDRLSVRGRYRLLEPLRYLNQLEVALGFQRIDDDRRTRPFGGREEVRERNRSDLYGGTVKLESRVAPWMRLIGGADLYLDLVASSASARDLESGAVAARIARFADGASVVSLGLFLQDEIRIGRWLSLVAGGRFSHYQVQIPRADRAAGVELALPDLTGSLGLIARLGPLIQLVANLGRSFRVPNVFDLSTLGPRPGNRFQVPNPSLRPEEAISTDVGVRIASRRVQGELFGFALLQQGKIEAVPTGERTDDGRAVIQSRNLNQGFVAGTELGARVRLGGGLDLFGNLTYTFGDETFPDGRVRPADRIPPLHGRLGLLWQPSRNVWVEFFVRFAGDQRRLSERDRTDPRIDPSGTSGWHTLHVRAGARLHERIALRISVENLTDRRYREHGSGVDGPGVNAIASIDTSF